LVAGDDDVLDKDLALPLLFVDSKLRLLAIDLLEVLPLRLLLDVDLVKILLDNVAYHRLHVIK
jgi:hypothetical protein